MTKKPQPKKIKSLSKKVKGFGRLGY